MFFLSFFFPPFLFFSPILGSEKCSSHLDFQFHVEYLLVKPKWIKYWISTVKICCTRIFPNPDLFSFCTTSFHISLRGFSILLVWAVLGGYIFWQTAVCFYENIWRFFMFFCMPILKDFLVFWLIVNESM